MARSLDDEARRLLALFEDCTGVSARDCLVSEERVVVLVEANEMASAIGPGGRTVRRFERRVDREVKLVEDADTPETFVANAFAPAAVYNVTISENDTTVAYAEVAHEDRGVAIGAEGRNIDVVRRLAERRFEIDDVELV